jgi:ADP-heptose:LPS heptosyltransferase
MKVLIIRFSSIGDIVLTTPVIRVIKQQLDARIHFVTKSRFKSLLESNPHVDHVHTLDGNLGSLIGELRKEKFDFIVDLHHNLRSFFIKVALGARSSSFNKLNFKKWLVVNFKINRLPSRHVVDRYLEAAAGLGIKNDLLGLDYFIPPSDEISMESLPGTHRRGYVAYAIGAQHFTKKLPVDRMIELCEKINAPILLLGGPEDKLQGEEIMRHFDQKANPKIYNGCGRYTLNQSASLLKNASIVFSHDTGLMHIAAAFGKTVFSIWGNTIPSFGMTPYQTRYTVLENNHLSCRPCSKIGFEKCPKGHFKCMRELVFDFTLPDVNS